MVQKPPKGFRTLLEEIARNGSNETRSLLCLGRIKACTLDEQSGVIVPIDPWDWTWPIADQWMSSGRHMRQLQGHRPWKPAEVSTLIIVGQNREEVPSVQRGGRPKGTGKRSDEILLERMHKLISAGEANSPTDAVRLVIEQDGGLKPRRHGASENAAIRRLSEKYYKQYGR